MIDRSQEQLVRLAAEVFNLPMAAVAFLEQDVWHLGHSIGFQQARLPQSLFPNWSPAGAGTDISVYESPPGSPAASEAPDELAFAAAGRFPKDLSGRRFALILGSPTQRSWSERDQNLFKHLLGVWESCQECDYRFEGRKISDLIGGLKPEGDNLYSWVARHLSEELQVSGVMVAEIFGQQFEKARALAMIWLGDELEQVEYDLRGTPCAEVITGQACTYSGDVVQKFPDDLMLQDMGIASYAGLPLLGQGRRPMGLVVALHQAKFPDSEKVLLEMQKFHDLLSEELSRQRILADLGRLAQSIDISDKGNIFSNLTFNLAKIVQAKMAFLGFRDSENQAKLLALWDRDEARDLPPDLPLTDSPFEKILSSRKPFLKTAKDLQSHQLPDWVDPNSAAAMLVIPFAVEAETEVGFFGVIHDRIFEKAVLEHPLMPVLINRAAAEIKRRQAEIQARQLERRLFEGQRLESLGLLAGGIAHDFNNLLMGIRGNLAMLEEELSDQKDLQPCLQGIQLASQQAVELSSQMLAYSGKSIRQKQVLDLAGLCREMEPLLRAVLPKRILLNFKFPASTCRVEADAVQIRQVLMNLVRNSAEAMDGNSGTVQVHLNRRKLEPGDLTAFKPYFDLEPGEFACLEVVDTGHGLDPKLGRHILDPFFSTKTAGRGLGLAVVQGLVRSHQGAVDWSCPARGGCCFRVLLPIAGDSAAIPPTKEEKEPFDAGSTEFVQATTHPILVVDDEDLVRQATGRMLESLGYSVLTAGSGREALDQFDPNRFALLLLDVAMPGMDGLELRRQLRSQDPELPIVMMSGYPLAGTQRNLADDPRTRFLLKPFGFRELKACLADLLAP